MAGEFRVITQDFIDIVISSTVSSFGSERRFDKGLTIADLKGKLELLTGCHCNSMKLELYSKDDKLLCRLDKDDALLGSYPINNGMRIHVVDNSMKLGEFEDVSKVEKFEISEDSYNTRTDSVRAFKQKMKLGNYKEVDPEEQQRLENEQQQKADEEKAKAESMKIGDRCETAVPKQPVRRGAVAYIGKTDFKPGYWIGIHYDEPVGKHDGSVQGKRYFECPNKYGGFAKPFHVTVGDFPEDDLRMDDDDEM